MKKKILVAVMAVICLLSMVLVGCSNIQVNDIDTDVIKVFQDAIANSEAYETYYVRERIDTDPKNVTKNKRTEVMLNYQADDKSIDGVNNFKANFSVKHTVGITEYTDSFIFGNSLPKNIKAKNANPSDYKLYVFENYKLKSTAPAFTRTSRPITIDEMNAYTNPLGRNFSDYTIKNALNPLRSLTASDVKIVNKGDEVNGIKIDKGSMKQGKVTTYVIEVINENHDYFGKGALSVQIYTDKKVSRIMSISSADATYTLDVMYQGPKIDIPNYDNFDNSDNIINVFSDRSDGLLVLYTKDSDGEMIFGETIDPVELSNKKVVVVENGNEVEYSYVITTVESAVNWAYEYTEVLIRLVVLDEDGNIVKEIKDDRNEYLADESIYIQTKNITKKKDMMSMIPMVAAIVAVIALLLALFALLKIKKQNKELTRKINALIGNDSSDETIIDAEVIDTNADDIKELETTTEDNAKAEVAQEVAEEVKAEDTAVKAEAEEPIKATKSKAKKADTEEKSE